MATFLTANQIQKLLTNLPPGAKITVSTPTGGNKVIVAEYQSKADIINARYARLKGRPITVTEAGDKYNVPRRTVIRWANQYGYVAVLNPGYQMELDEADVAYCAEVHHARGGRSGAPLLDEDGLPYELKHPTLSTYRRRKKQDED